VQHKPRIYQRIGGRTVDVSGGYRIAEDGRVRFEVPRYNHKHTLVIDPALVYSKAPLDQTAASAAGIAVDGSGNAYIAGTTFPIFPGGVFGFYIIKLDPSGNVVANPFEVGGSSGNTFGNAIALDSSGNIYVVGQTNASGLIDTNTCPNCGFQSGLANAAGGAYDGFLFACAGTVFTDPTHSVNYVTYMGGAANDVANAVAVVSPSAVYVAGSTGSLDFPASPGQAFTGQQKAFLVKVDTTQVTGTGSRVWAIFVGGTGTDTGAGVAVDAFGNAYLVGTTTSPSSSFNPSSSTGFNPIKTNANTDGYLNKIDSAGQNSLYFTYFANGQASAVAVVGTTAYVTGKVASPGGLGNVTATAAQPSFGGGANDAFLFRVETSQSGLASLAYSTYLGGAGDDAGYGVAADTSGKAYIAGSTTGGFPVKNAIQGTYGGGNDDPFYAVINTTLSGAGSLLSATYLGSGADDLASSVAVSSTGVTYIAGFVSGAGGAFAAKIADGQEIGSVDLAGNAGGVGTVVKGSTLYVYGWAADTATGAPVQSVTVFVDGNNVGTATLGGARSDVASAYGRSDFTNSGWSFQISTSTLSLGQHTVTAMAAGPSGTAPLVGSKIVNITAQGQEIGSVDLAGNASGNTTVVKGATLYVYGWAADTATGAPVQSVTVFMDGNSVGTATLGLARSDVASAYGRSDYTNSGWSFQMSTSALAVGQHTVTATSMGPSGTAQVGSKTVNITTQGQEIGSVDLAGNASGNGTVVKNATLYVYGWAADTSTGAPVQSVTVFVDGNSVGTATLGSARSDVASAYGRSDFTNSGWSFQMSTSTLGLGQHTVTATAIGPSGTAQLSASRTVNITAQGQEIGSVDIAGNANGSATVTKGNTLFVFGWAADTATGAPVQSVTIFVDGGSVGTATLGLARSDVASAYGRSDFTNSGWSFQMSTSTLSLGQHTVTATAAGPSGTAQVGAKTVTIQ
jgi:hypothetical protein